MQVCSRNWAFMSTHTHKHTQLSGKQLKLSPKTETRYQNLIQAPPSDIMCDGFAVTTHKKRTSVLQHIHFDTQCTIYNVDP